MITSFIIYNLQAKSNARKCVTLRIIWRGFVNIIWRTAHCRSVGLPSCKGRFVNLLSCPQVTQYHFATLKPKKIQEIVNVYTNARFRNSARRFRRPTESLTTELSTRTPNSAERSAPNNSESCKSDIKVCQKSLYRLEKRLPGLNPRSRRKNSTAIIGRRTRNATLAPRNLSHPRHILRDLAES